MIVDVGDDHFIGEVGIFGGTVVVEAGGDDAVGVFGEAFDEGDGFFDEFFDRDAECGGVGRFFGLQEFADGVKTCDGGDIDGGVAEADETGLVADDLSPGIDPATT